jgi:hypothetical protein
MDYVASADDKVIVDAVAADAEALDTSGSAGLKPTTRDSGRPASTTGAGQSSRRWSLWTSGYRHSPDPVADQRSIT